MDIVEFIGKHNSNSTTDSKYEQFNIDLRALLNEHSKSPDELIDKIEAMKDDSGREGCTYGDTKYDSLSAVYGYNLAIENVVDVLSKQFIRTKGVSMCICKSPEPQFIFKKGITLCTHCGDEISNKR